MILLEKKIFVAFGLMLLFVWNVSAESDPFADNVVMVEYGAGSGFGEEYFPGNVLGAPNGNADAGTPQDSAEHLLSLGDGGWIILEFTGTVILDGTGADLAVFENPVITGGDSDRSFVEAAIVAVSQDGETFYTFPFDYIPPENPEDPELGEWSHYVGFAGVHPSFSSPANGINPIDPEVSGGDFFDLADVGLSWAKYVKITDTGIPDTPTAIQDEDGDAIDDPGNIFSFPTAKTVGFDLDAVAAIHSGNPPTSADSWEMYR